jgi:dTDP-glucose 4,6-dehydratase
MRIQDGRAIPSFLSQAIQGKPLTVYGDGSQTRSFCYVSDLVEGIYRLLNSSYHLPVNLGNPREMTILEMAREVLKVTRSRSRIVYRPLPEDDPKVRQPCIDLAQRLLHWKPKVALAQGLRTTFKDFRARLKSR